MDEYWLSRVSIGECERLCVGDDLMGRLDRVPMRCARALTKWC